MEGRDSPSKQVDLGGRALQGAACNEAISVQSHRDIGWAVKQLWNGALVRRRGWNGRRQHLALQIPGPSSKMSLPYVYIKTVRGELVPWLCSQTDLLATDWELAEF